MAPPLRGHIGIIEGILALHVLWKYERIWPSEKGMGWVRIIFLFAMPFPFSFLPLTVVPIVFCHAKGKRVCPMPSPTATPLDKFLPPKLLQGPRCIFLVFTHLECIHNIVLIYTFSTFVSPNPCQSSPCVCLTPSDTVDSIPEPNSFLLTWHCLVNPTPQVGVDFNKEFQSF